VAVLWLLKSLHSTQLKVLIVAQEPIIKALVLNNLSKYRRKSHIAKKGDSLGYIR